MDDNDDESLELTEEERNRELPGFSKAEIAESLKPFFDEIDADYQAALEPLVKVFAAKGPPKVKNPAKDENPEG